MNKSFEVSLEDLSRFLLSGDARKNFNSIGNSARKLVGKRMEKLEPDFLASVPELGEILYSLALSGGKKSVRKIVKKLLELDDISKLSAHTQLVNIFDALQKSRGRFVAKALMSKIVKSKDVNPFLSNPGAYQLIHIYNPWMDKRKALRLGRRIIELEEPDRFYKNPQFENIVARLEDCGVMGISRHTVSSMREKGMDIPINPPRIGFPTSIYSRDTRIDNRDYLDISPIDEVFLRYGITGTATTIPVKNEAVRKCEPTTPANPCNPNGDTVRNRFEVTRQKGSPPPPSRPFGRN